MLLSLLVYLLISNAFSLRKDKSILFSRIVMVSLVLISLIAYINIIVLSLNKDMAVFGDLFHIRACSHIFVLFLVIICMMNYSNLKSIRITLIYKTMFYRFIFFFFYFSIFHTLVVLFAINSIFIAILLLISFIIFPLVILNLYNLCTIYNKEQRHDVIIKQIFLFLLFIFILNCLDVFFLDISWNFSMLLIKYLSTIDLTDKLILSSSIDSANNTVNSSSGNPSGIPGGGGGENNRPNPFNQSGGNWPGGGGTHTMEPFNTRRQTTDNAGNVVPAYENVYQTCSHNLHLRAQDKLNSWRAQEALTPNVMFPQSVTLEGIGVNSQTPHWHILEDFARGYRGNNVHVKTFCTKILNNSPNVTVFSNTSRGPQRHIIDALWYHR